MDNQRDVGTMALRAMMQHGTSLTLAAGVALDNSGSADGLTVTTATPVASGTEVTLYPLLDDFGNELFELKGTVTTCARDGGVFASNRFHVGVHLELDQVQRRQLAELVGQRSRN